MSYSRPLSEPIAIVGSSCRFAGGATSPSRLWDVLCCAPDLSREVPAARFAARAFYHRDGDYHGTANALRAYWLEQDHRVFDAGFFNVTPKEAEAVDPQQRLLLEVVYEAVESSGCRDFFGAGAGAGADVGVFSGCMTGDYDTLSQRDELSTSQYYATGNSRAIISNRISYFFDFQGPSVTVDTACSSSLVALHQAVLSLRARECAAACVAGVNLMITPEQFIVESTLNMLSPSGRCRMWDAGADGYARGEGVAAVLLKPLSRALADGDAIEAVIRDVGVNSDGRTRGITMPNSESQARLIERTYRKSGLDPRNPTDRCQYFEAHGTGTQAGDPQEASALDEAFFRDSLPGDEKKMLVGSVKTVIGHTEGAAGLAGLLKAVEGLKRGAIPPNLHLKSLNPKVKLSCAHLEIPMSVTPWPEPPAGQPRRASVNSFGFGGTNAHAIVEQYVPSIHDELVGHLPPVSDTLQKKQTQLPPDICDHQDFYLPLTFSAASQKSLRDVVHSFRGYLAEHPDSTHELAWALFSRRTAHAYRVSVSAATASQAQAALDSLLGESKTKSQKGLGMRSKATTGLPRKILGVFTGQGAQWPAMSRSLLQTNEGYRESIRGLDRTLAACPDPPEWTLEAQILAGEDVSRIHEAAVSQPLCTALQIGLVDLLHSLGIGFHAVVGHSSGEIAAAYAAGMLSAHDAILISYYRGRFACLAGGEDGQKGGMLAAGLSEDEAQDFCKEPEFGGRLCLAASNAPSSVTLAGDLDAVQQAKEMLTAQNKFARTLVVDTAYHSPHMSRPAVKYVDALRRLGISPMPASQKCVWVSSVHGSSTTGEEDLGCGYWKDNMVHRVRFRSAIETALSEHGPFDLAVEVGPHFALKGPVTQTAKAAGQDLAYTSILDRQKNDSHAVSDFLGFLWSSFGPAAVDLGAYLAMSPKPAVSRSRLTDLPNYPFDHSAIHYRESRLSRQYHFKREAPHELLGVRTRDDNEHLMRWRNILRLEKIPWLEHHRFQGQALLPASAYCVMALDASRYLLDGRPAAIVELRDLRIMSGISIERDSPGTEVLFSLQVLCVSASSVEASFSLASCPADGTTAMKLDVTGNLKVTLGDPHRDALPNRVPCVSETFPADPDAFYKMMDDMGLVYTGPYRSLESTQRRYNYCFATLRRRHPEDTTPLEVSPATLDSCFQSAFLAYASPGDKSLWTSFLPCTIDRVRFNMAALHRDPEADTAARLAVDTHMTSCEPATHDSKATFTVDIGIFAENGDAEVQVEGLAVCALANTQPKDDYELYLHTVVDLDPTDAIVSMRPTASTYDGQLEESLDEAQARLELHRHAARVVQQIAHRYARMNVLSFSLPGAGLEELVVDAVESPFQSLTICSEAKQSGIKHVARPGSLGKQTVRQVSVDLKEKLPEQLASDTPVDLVILSTAWLENDATAAVLLKNIQEVMKPEAFLVLVHISGTTLTSSSMATTGTSTPPQWPDLLEHCGFIQRAKNADQSYYPGYIAVRQNFGFESPRACVASDALLIGGTNPGEGTQLINGLTSHLYTIGCNRVSNRSLDVVNTEDLDGCTAAIVLADLDEPITSNMTEHRLSQLRTLFRPNMTLLWLTREARSNPDHAATLGFLRTIIAEVPNLRVQVLDLDHLENSPGPLIAASFARLVGEDTQGADEALLTREPELHIQDGLRYIPRVVPLEPANARLNALRRVVTKKLDVLQDCVELVARGDPYHAKETELETTKPPAGHVLIRVDYSSVEPVCHLPHEAGADVHLIGLVVRSLTAKSIARRLTAGQQVVLLGADDELFDCVAHVVKPLGTQVHAASTREISDIFPEEGALVLDLLRGQADLSRRIREVIPSNSKYISQHPTARPEQWICDSAVESAWRSAVSWAVEKEMTASLQTHPSAHTASVAEILSGAADADPFRIVDWRADTSVSQTVDHVVEERLFSPAKTYLLVGMTRDLGQSLCRLLVEHGARHVVLASRNPDTSPRWAGELVRRHHGRIRVAVERVDAADAASVRALRARLAAAGLPPVGGVVNGAMVLDDRVFAQMTPAVWERVARPKTTGSRNLDAAFDGGDGDGAGGEQQQPPLDFFVMTSSFAAVGGHPGQSNYAAANMYMNGLAARRRRRGLAGSVLNIGVIYGLGFLHRERRHLYAGLAREGYPPISERDIHHMFLEAVVAGRPGREGRGGAPADITTGLSRFRVGIADPLYWHRDPRFSHFSVHQEEGEDGGGSAGGDAAANKTLGEQVAGLSEPDDVAESIFAAFTVRLEALLQLPLDSVNKDDGILQLGVDSLMAVEIRNWFWRTLGKDVSVLKVLGVPSIYRLCRELAEQILAEREGGQKHSTAS
ncbi:hypothetical protein GGR56DRAFT_669110 [Xylariaceae sp. FL0804]|nr:hypothetical protein GGR56DRAFT_669110 [Xylariaceae sp. FL0804]